MAAEICYCMLDLVLTKDLVNAEFKASCRVHEALRGLSDSIELGGYVGGGRQNKGDYFVTEWMSPKKEWEESRQSG